MFCRFCGRAIPDGSMFCRYCGKQLTLPEQIPECAPEISQVPTAAPRSEKKRWIVLGLMLLILAAAIAALFLTKVICIHKWQEATCTMPITCARCHDTEGEALGHTLTDATCTDPISCTTCQETFGRALGHDLRKATCTQAEKCARCKMSWGKPKDHDWIEETFTTPKTCEDCGAMRPMKKPESGTIYIDEKNHHGSKLSLKAAADYCTYAKLKDADGNDVFSFFVRAGETAEVRVPTGNYYLYLAHGINWYGPDLAFGADTFYEKNEDVLDFYNYTWEYIIDAGPDGNAVVTEIDETQF